MRDCICAALFPSLRSCAPSRGQEREGDVLRIELQGPDRVHGWARPFYQDPVEPKIQMRRQITEAVRN